MKRRIISLVSLLLVLVMAFVSCANDKKVYEDPKPDNPVTAEGVLNNFLSFKKAEDVKPINNAAHLNDSLGQTYEVYGDYAIFVKETKDRLNNLTETYSVYSIADKAVAFTVSNTYADEWGWEDDFGNVTYPEKVIDEVDIVDDYGIVYFVVEWTAYTPINEEIIEEEELEWSYTESEYCEFYDVKGNLIATSHVEDEGEGIDYNDYYTVVSFGRTTAVFDNETSEVVMKYDGDVEPTPPLYDFMNDWYNYMLNVPVAGISPDVNPNLSMVRTAIRVYDKEGGLVLDYVHGDNAINHIVEVLDNGDILIQNMYVANTVDYDYFYEGMKVNVDTVILDVETGKVTEIADFDYLVNGVYFAEDILEENDAYTFTENVRNIAYARDMVEDKLCTIFFDNFGNVNFIFDGKLAYEKEDNSNLYVEQCTVLREDRLLITLASGVAEKAIIDNSGNVIAYLNENCLVLDDYIAVVEPDYSIEVFDFDMKAVKTISNSWVSYYINLEDTINFYGTLGNSILFSIVDKWNDYGVSGDPVPMQRDIIYSVDVTNGYSSSKTDYVFVTYNTVQPEGFVVVKKETKEMTTPLFLVLNENAQVVLTVSASNVEIVYCEDAIALLKIHTADGTECYLLDAKYSNENEPWYGDEGGKY